MSDNDQSPWRPLNNTSTSQLSSVTTSSTPRSTNDEDFLNQGVVPTKTVIINILNKFISRRPAKEDLVQNRVLKSDYKPIPVRYNVIDTLCSHLEKYALEIEGIFRISGSANQIRLFWATFINDNIDFTNITNEHNVSGALKLYVREQVDPILPYEIWSTFVSTISARDTELECSDLVQLFSKISTENTRILKRILKTIIIMVRHSDFNKMNPINMGIVFGPCLFKSKADSPNVFNEAKYSSEVVTKLVQNYNRIFPDLEVPILGTETNTEEDELDGASTPQQSTQSQSQQQSTPQQQRGPDPNSNLRAVLSAVNSQPRSLSPKTIVPITSSPSTSNNTLLSPDRSRGDSTGSNKQQLNTSSSSTPTSSNLDIHRSLLGAQNLVDPTKISPLAHLKPLDFSMINHLKRKLSKTKHFKSEEIWDHFLALRINGNVVQAQKQFSTMMSTSHPTSSSMTMIVDKKKKKDSSSNLHSSNANNSQQTNLNLVPIYILITSKNIFIFDSQSYEIESILPHDRLKEFAMDTVNQGLFSFLDNSTHKLSYYLMIRLKSLDYLIKNLERGRSIAKLSNKTMAHLQPRKFAMLEQNNNSSSSNFGKLPESRPVFESLAARGFSELDVWEGTVDLLEIVKQFDKILVATESKAVVEFLLPGIEEFKGIYRKSYKLDIKTTVYKIICLICEKAKLSPSKFVLRTLKGRTLYDNLSLSSYGLGTLFTTWQLRLISLDAPESTGNFVVEFQLPDTPEFKNMQKKSIKVDAYQPLKRIMKGLCNKLKVPKYHYYDLIGPEGQVLGGDDILSSIGLGIKFKTCKMRLQKKTFPVGRGKDIDTPIVQSILSDIMDSVWQKLQDRHHERIRIYCKHLLEYIVDQTFVELSKAETVPKRVSMLGHNSRAEFYSLLANKEEEDLILQDTNGYKNMVIQARSVGGIIEPSEPIPNAPLFRPSMLRVPAGMSPLPRNMNGTMPTLRDIKVSNAKNVFMSELQDVRDHLKNLQLQNGGSSSTIGQSILLASRNNKGSSPTYKSTFISSQSNQLNSIVLQLQSKPGTSKLVQQLKSRMSDVTTDSSLIEDLLS